MKVIVSHSKKQHVYRLVYGLQKYKRLEKFYTSLFFSEKSILIKILSLSSNTKKIIKKREFILIEKEKVSLTFIPELISHLLPSSFGSKRVFYMDRLQDNIVSFLLKFQKYDIFIGYEGQSLKSFKQAKSLNKITILDLASIDNRETLEINRKYNNIITGAEDYMLDLLKRKTLLNIEELKYTDYIICLSDFAKNSCIKHGFPKERIKVVSLGIDTEFFSLKKDYNSKIFEIIFVAGLRYFKGIKDLIDVFKELRLDNAILTIVGGLGDAQEYVINESKNINNINYLYYLEHDELKLRYQEASISVLPTYLDSFPQVAFESMACGTPVITTTNSGAPKFIKNGENGYIIDVGDKKVLKEKILYFYENREEIERQGRNARKSVENLTWDSYYENINKIMDEIYNDKKTK